MNVSESILFIIESCLDIFNENLVISLELYDMRLIKILVFVREAKLLSLLQTRIITERKYR